MYISRIGCLFLSVGSIECLPNLELTMPLVKLGLVPAVSSRESESDRQSDVNIVAYVVL